MFLVETRVITNHWSRCDGCCMGGGLPRDSEHHITHRIMDLGGPTVSM